MSGPRGYLGEAMMGPRERQAPLQSVGSPLVYGLVAAGGAKATGLWLDAATARLLLRGDVLRTPRQSRNDTTDEEVGPRSAGSSARPGEV
jgi:hypothetical protein